MASYNELNALIDAYINRNGVQAITGQILNGVLKAMVEQLGRGYTIMGAATPATDPGTPDGPECYFASETGTYTDFDGLQVVPGELALLCYTPTDGWTKATIYEGFQEVQATIDGNVGTPSVGVSYANGVLSFDFRNMKGNPGDAAGFGAIGADITGGIGTPGVTVESSGPATAKNLQFHFTNLKGETGVTSVVATVDDTTGTPACTVSLVGQQLTLAFSGLKGAQGNTGSSVDYPFTIVNNLTTNDATQALSAAMGVELAGQVSQLQQKVDELDATGGEITELYLANYSLGTNGKFGSNTTYKHAALPVEPGQVYYLVGESTNCRAAFATSNEATSGGDISLVSGTSVMGMPNIGEYYKFTIPAGCSYFLFNASGTYGTRCFKSIGDAFGELYGDIAKMGAFFTANNPIRKDTGATQTSTPTFKNTGYIPIKNYSDIEIHGYDGGSSYNYTICAFYDGNKVFISSYPNTTAGMQTVSIPASSIPSGAAYIRCTTQAEKVSESYVFCNISKVLSDNLETNKADISNNLARTGKLELSQYGVLNSADVSVEANTRLQQYMPVTGTTVRFRVILLSGTPSFTTFPVYGGTESTPLGVVVIRGCEFGKVYTTKIRTTDTGITVRSSNSTSAFSARVEILDAVSDDAKNLETERHETVKTLYDLNYAVNGDGRLSAFFPCSGALRITVKCTSGTPAGKYYRVYFGTEQTPTSVCGMGNTPIGETTELFLSEDYAFTGIDIFITTADTTNVNYNIIIEQLDTEEQKAAHRERILCFGDSITAFDGQNSIGTDVGRDGMRYSDYMQLFRPGISLTNIGIGGTRLAQRTETLPDTPTDNSHAYAALDMVNLVNAVCSGDFSVQDAAATFLADSGITAKLTRAKAVDITKIDIVTILGGTNDWAGDNSLGTVDDTSVTTTLGALNTIISTLLTANPRLRIYIALPPVRYKGSTYTDEYWCDTYKNENNQTLLELCESIEAVAKRNYIPTIDLHRELGWNKQNFWTFFISPDGTHPIAGFGWIARKILHDIF